MQEESNLEVWMRGPVPNVPPLLQPVAHALLQVEEDIKKYTNGFDDRFLWLRPGGRASVAFHIRHIIGVIDRMFTYALGNPLSEKQFAYLSSEGIESGNISLVSLLDEFHRQITKAMSVLEETDSGLLIETRFLGRKRIPTTTIGLFFHAAEHAQRHVGQLLVTVDWVKNMKSK